MHMRTKKWAKPELAVCPYFTDEPETKRGRWRAQFEREQPLYLELGCGKGVSTATSSCLPCAGFSLRMGWNERFRGGRGYERIY